jgi:hypothetical protein
MAKTIRLTTFVLAVVLAPALAHAQLGIYRPQNPATGERYNIEFSYGFWDPSPAIVIANSALNLVGTEIDGVTDLGFQRNKVRDLHLILRPAKKHKFRFEYLPISYAAQSVLTRTVTFGGVSYTRDLAVASTLEWKAYRFGYEYDLIYRDSGFLGVIGSVEYAQVRASLTSDLASGSVDERKPIPAIGAIARGYLVRNVSMTGELSWFKLPNGLIANTQGHYVDYDVYGTVNFTNSVGVQAGYRSRDAWFTASDTTANLKLKGLYFRGVVRF